MKYVQVGLLLMAATLLVGSAMISRADAQLCGIGVSKLMTCKPAVTNPPAAPTTECCSMLKNANLQCLCSYKDQMKAFNLDPKLVMALPKKCKVSNVPSACK